MKKLKSVLKKMSKSEVITSLALVLVTVSEMAMFTCTFFVFGQEDMPEELL